MWLTLCWKLPPFGSLKRQTPGPTCTPNQLLQATVAQVSQKVWDSGSRSDTPFAGHEEPRGLATKSSQRASWKGLLPGLLPSTLLAYLGILHAGDSCVLPPHCPGSEWTHGAPPPKPPVRTIGTPESPLPFRKQKISFTVNILLRRLISSSKVFEGHRTAAQRSDLQTPLLRAG